MVCPVIYQEKKETGFLNKVKEELLSLIYPKVCFSCHAGLSPLSKYYICEDCAAKIKKMAPPFCMACGKTIDIPDLTDFCLECSGERYAFSRGFSAVIYSGIIKDYIKHFKYSGQSFLGETLAFFMVDFAEAYIPLSDIDYITHVPLHWKRKRDRGFNQSGILGRILSQKTGIKYLPKALCRVKEVLPQAMLPKEKRIKNLRNAFAVREKDKIRDKRILLIDDVFTTGATFNECSKVLLNSGAKDVWIFSLARGVLVLLNEAF